MRALLPLRWLLVGLLIFSAAFLAVRMMVAGDSASSALSVTAPPYEVLVATNPSPLKGDTDFDLILTLSASGQPVTDALVSAAMRGPQQTNFLPVASTNGRYVLHHIGIVHGLYRVELRISRDGVVTNASFAIEVISGGVGGRNELPVVKGPTVNSPERTRGRVVWGVGGIREG